VVAARAGRAHRICRDSETQDSGAQDPRPQTEMHGIQSIEHPYRPALTYSEPGRNDVPFCPHCGKRVEDADTLCRHCGRPAGIAAPGAKKQGIPLVVWIVAGVGCAVVAIALLGIVAAILIPNFLDALQKAKQKRSVADLRSVAVALSSYQDDHEGLPPGDTLDQVAPALEEGGYLAEVPRTDGWKNPFRYECLEVLEGVCQSFRLASAGQDGEFEHQRLAEYPVGQFHRIEYHRDLVVGDAGMFVQSPSTTPPAERGPP